MSPQALRSKFARIDTLRSQLREEERQLREACESYTRAQGYLVALGTERVRAMVKA